MKRVIGIDPGKTGALACLSKDKEGFSLSVVEGNDPHTLVKTIKTFKPQLVVVEKQQAMSKQGVTSTFTTGRGFGLIEGVLIGTGTKYIIVDPKTWMKKIWDINNPFDLLADLPSSLKESKVKNISLSNKLFGSDYLLTKGGRWKDGAADAMLIALYGFHL